MPVLPLVGSTITVLPGAIMPSRSAASIIARPMRSLTLASGFWLSSFATTCGVDAARHAVEPHERRVADQLGDVVCDLHGVPRLGTRTLEHCAAEPVSAAGGVGRRRPF